MRSCLYTVEKRMFTECETGTYKSCSKGFMYDPDSLLRCAAEFSQMRSCLYTVEKRMFTECEGSMDAVLDANSTNQLTPDVNDTLVQCVRGQVTQGDLTDEKLQYTDAFLISVEAQAKAGTGLFEGYEP